MAGKPIRLRRLFALLAVLLAARGGLSLALRLRSVHEALRSRVERAFGRPVEAGRFDVSVWSGLRLEAHYITVAEEPQFGSEFVLRADELSASPDLRALIRGHLEFSQLSFDRPSLNLVRDRDARWNFEGWAPALRKLGAPAGGAGSTASRVHAVVISNGRINFKRGADKLPFALVGVNGRLAQAADGRWGIALEAQPLRAGVTLQDAGTLRGTGTLTAAALSTVVAGRPAGTGPAEFSLQWSKASLSDALRLIAGTDYGVRGALDASFSAQNPAPAVRPGASADAVGESASAPPRAWKISGTLRLADVHRWDMPLEALLPGLNLSFDATGSADRREWEFREIVLEARRSNVRASAAFRVGENSRASVRVVTASIHLDDLLAWYRAFHGGVRPGTWLDGYLGADVELQGWPLRVVRGTLATTGARLNVAGEKEVIELRRAVVEADAKGAILRDAHFAVGERDAGMHLAARAEWEEGVPFEASLAGSTSRLAEVSTAVAALGLASGARPLRADGSVTARLKWNGTSKPWRVATSGTLGLEGVALSGGPLRSEISVGSAKAEFLPAQRRVQLAATKAFGATWSGTLRAATLAGPWEFALAADRLNPAAMVRGFASPPAENSSLLSRILPPQAASTLAREQPVWPGWLRGEGKITAGALAVGRLEFERVQAAATIGERAIRLDAAEGSAYGGRVHADVRADFGEQPHYTVRARFDGVNVAALAAVAASARQCCTGTASGEVELSASGWDRDGLFASLKGSGRAEVQSGALLTLDLPASVTARDTRAGRTLFRTASGDFDLAPNEVHLDVDLGLQAESLAAGGNATYRGELAFDVVRVPKTPSASLRGVRISGTLAAPAVAPSEKSP